jgi:hypothetical protein
MAMHRAIWAALGAISLSALGCGCHPRSGEARVNTGGQGGDTGCAGSCKSCSITCPEEVPVPFGSCLAYSDHPDICGDWECTLYANAGGASRAVTVACVDDQWEVAFPDSYEPVCAAHATSDTCAADMGCRWIPDDPSAGCHVLRSCYIPSTVCTCRRFQEATGVQGNCVP